MAENTKTFSIVINGIQESVKAVDSLNDALGMLEQRMKAVQSSTVSVGLFFEDVPEHVLYYCR